jgi:prevent-host-death family protein
MANYTYTYARENLAKVMERLAADREHAIITRRGHEDMAMLPADELTSLQETAYLLRSPANATRLLKALNDSLGLTLPRAAAADLDRVNAAVSARAKRARKPSGKK